MQKQTKRSAGFYLQAALWYPLFYCIAALPFPVLYAFSDFIRFLVHKVFKYRVKVVRMNLQNAFPGYSPMRLKEIEAGFYRQLCDMMVETIKLLVISNDTLSKRVYIRPENNVFDKIYRDGKSVIVVMGHYGNWEMICQGSTNLTRHTILVTYKPISNAFFQSFFTRVRTRQGAHVISMQDTLRAIISRKNEVIMPVMLSDQTPSDTNGVHWQEFLSQDTPVMMGIEKIARKMNYMVVGNEVVVHGRGVYELVPKVLVSDPAALPEGEITRIHTEWLEQIVKQKPDHWLWSHRRWKHKRLIS